MCKVTIIYHSNSGHTQHQAEAIHKGVLEVEGVDSELLTVQEASAKLDDLDNSDAIIFGCPTYMGNISADMKQFLEAAVHKWKSLSWKNKIAGAFTSSGSFSGDKLNTLVGLMINAMQHGMIFVGYADDPNDKSKKKPNGIDGPGPEEINRVRSFIGPMMANFNSKTEQKPASGDLLTGERYGKRIAELTLKLKRS